MSDHPACELIVRGIVIDNGRLLVNKSTNRKTGEDYFALPGGHLDPGDTCTSAVVREFEEELDVKVRVEELSFVSESLYPGRKKSDSQRHELVLYFKATLELSLKEENGLILSPEPSKQFQWLPMTQLPDANLLPAAIKQFLLDSLPHAAFVFENSTEHTR